MKTLIIANGNVNQSLFDKVGMPSIDKIIAADGGAAKALACGLMPDVVIGDFDSLPRGFQEQHKNMQFIHRPSQEINDLEKALQYCETAGCVKITIIGVTGDRVDHTINNFSVLAKYDQRFQFKIFCPHARIYMVRQELSVHARKGQVISLIPLGRVEGVATEGLEFPLNDKVLALGEREGAGNRTISGPFRIAVKSGLLLVFVNDLE